MKRDRGIKGLRDQGEARPISVPSPSVPPFFIDPSEPALGVPLNRAGAMLPADLLLGGETILLLLKPSTLYIVLGCWETLLVIAAVGVGSLWLERAFAGEWFEDRAMVGLCLILAAVRLFYQFMEWMSRTYVLTDRRVIRIMGVWRVQMFQAPLSGIQQVHLLHTIREKSFGLGTISFSTTARPIPDAYWVMVARPEAVHREVTRAMQRYGR